MYPKFAVRQDRIRKPVSMDVDINDMISDRWSGAKITSLSMGGCLIKTSKLPDRFRFVITLDGGEKVSGEGIKLYNTSKDLFGVKFKELPVRGSELIETTLIEKA